MITSQDKEIQALIADIKEGRLLLPEMQRGYVWKAPQVRNLFDSLYRNYPSGQLLIWETDDLPYTRSVSVDELGSAQRRPQLLLDGQQRLTSLSAVMLGKPLHVRDFKRPIDIVFNIFTEQFAVAGPRQRGEAGWISLTKLFTEGPMRILRDLRGTLSDKEEDLAYERLTRLENIKFYKYRVNVLEQLTYEEVTDIFVRINSGGTILGHADLALAQISSRWHGVTEAIAEFQWPIWKKHNLWLDTGLLLRAMSLVLTSQSQLSQFFRGERQKITVDELQNVWKRVTDGLNQAIIFITNNCKIDRLELLSSNYVLVPLAIFFDRFGSNVSGTQARDLQRWVYMALIWSRYSSGLESTLNQDIAALGKDQAIQGMIQNLEDKVGHNRLVTERDLREQRKNSPFMLMAYVLARYANAEDWFNGVKIGGDQELELHHIFPKAVLRERYNLQADSRTVDQVANLAFLSRRANRRINSQSPAEYLPHIEEERLKDQYVPFDPALWTIERFEDFALQRRTLLAEGINKLLRSLTDRPAVHPISDVQVLEMRVDVIEHQLRDVVADVLVDSRGEEAWSHCIPKNVQSAIEFRIEQRLRQKPFEAGMYDSLAGKLQMCQFSDYAKIIKHNASLFSDIFGEVSAATAPFEQHYRAVTAARNAFKHNNSLSRSDLASAEAGLLWLEDCLQSALQTLEAAEETEIEDEEEEVAFAPPAVRS